MNEKIDNQKTGTKMKRIRILLALLHLSLFALASNAAVPLRWTVETSRLQPVVFDVVRGETLELEASFNSYGKPVATSNQTAFICWQTNGMGSAWWTTNAFTTATVARVLFTPQMDPGAPVVHGFIGLSDATNSNNQTIQQSNNYRAAFTLRFRHGPGETPNAMPLPTPTIDCQKVTFLNPESAPFSGGGGGGGTSTNAVNAIIRQYDETNLTARIEAKADPSVTNGFVKASITNGLITAEEAGNKYLDTKSKISWDNDDLIFNGLWLVTKTILVRPGNCIKVGPSTEYGDGKFSYENMEFDFPSESGTLAITDQFSDYYDKSEVTVISNRVVVDATNAAKSYTDAQFTTNNTALVDVVTNLAPAKARGISLTDPVRHCNWYQVVTNGVFFWLVEE